MPKIRVGISPIWNFFEVCDIADKKAICKSCKNIFSYKSTITNLKLHLRKKHIGVYEEFCQSEQPNNILETKEQQTVLDNVNNAEIKICNVDKGYEELDSDGGESKNLIFGGGEEPSTYFYISSVQSQEAIPSTSKHPSNCSITKTSVFSYIPRELESNEKGQIDKCLLKLITQDFQPFSIVDNEGFKEFTKALNPYYDLPHRKTLSNKLLPAEYESRLNSVKQLVNDFCQTICVTIDCWTSRNVTSYIAVTGHFINVKTLKYENILIQCSALEGSHTSGNIAKELIKIAEEWKITNKINLLVTDNAANMIGAANLLGWNHFECYLQKLNLIVQEALSLEVIACIVQKVHTIVAHFKRSTIAEDELLKYQITAQNVPTGSAKSLIISIPIRWNSTYLMLSRFAELQEALNATIPNLTVDLPIIEIEEWQSIDQLIEVLKPFYEVTIIMSAEKYLSASTAVVITQGLIAIFENMLSKNYYPVITDVIRLLKNGLITRLGGLEHNEAVGICTYLDPRFKEHAFSDRDALSKLKCVLLGKVAALLRSDTVVAENSTIKHDDIDSASVWWNFERKVQSIQLPKSAEVKATEELETYLKEGVIPRTCCPLEWWREHRHIYPSLYSLFLSHCNIMLTSVPCEREFSKAGDILSDRRTRLTSSKLTQIMFLNVNGFNDSH